MRAQLKYLVVSATLLASAPALAQDADKRCEFYGHIGGVMSEFMLPLTLQEIVDMTSGKDKELLGKMTMVLMQGMTSDDFTTLMATSEDDIGMLAEAAGTSAMMVLMAGEATTPEEVDARLLQTCEAMTADELIASQRAVNATQAQIAGQ